jgi:uncharacterized membrane protein
MNLQDIYYTLGIIFDVLFIILLLGIFVLLFYIKQKVTAIYESVEQPISKVRDAINHPENIAANLGAALAQRITRSDKRKK